MAGRVLRVIAVLIMIISVVVAGRIAWVGYGPASGPGRVPAQVRFLQGSLAGGAEHRMQQLFPEGAYFLTALTASAAVGHAEPSDVRVLRDRLDSPDLVATFGSGMAPDHGIFQAGWALSTAVDLAVATQDPADLEDVRRRATAVDRAFRDSPSGFLEGYPRQFWPCDSVVAAAALARAAELLERPDLLSTVRVWRDRVSRSTDPTTGLLPHRVDASGTSLEGPRGSSQAIIQAFWPAIGQALDGQVDRAVWDRFRSAFIVRRAGLVGVREFPVGQGGAGDVDSGPLILGVSASASVVALAAAREVGDARLAEALDREAELLGVPLAWGGERRYAVGLLPVGDAFLVWARSRPAAVGLDQSGPRPLWPVMIAIALVPALLSGLALGLGARRRANRRRGLAPSWSP